MIHLRITSVIWLIAMAVASASTLAASTQPAIRDDRNIAYGPDPLQKLDVYYPPDAVDAPVIFMVHGGGWRRGDKSYRNVVANKVKYWTQKGYVFISTNYRLLPDADPLEQADDVAKALAFAQENAQSWGADPNRFILMGHSAGAHLVALITADPAIATRQGARTWLGTVALDSAAYDVVAIMQQRHFPLYDEAFGDNHGFWEKSSPIHRLRSASVPMLLICSSRRILSCRNAKAFAKKDQSLGGEATLVLQDLSHGQINAELGLPGSYTDRVDAFMQSLLAEKR